ncbi:hypothetical protein CFC21_080875 [Triticum aestivum]|uniref:F-box domain-containing protein n=2 Tax=Triticum aestivum TaxID=4565 RepID=A0A3B6N245_WHEAT|nr:hypothetical protein CFC21_080875 [Triticum aestivum]
MIDQQPKEEDRLSMLTDDILLSILARVDVRTAARTSALSTQWRRLPWLLPEISINAKKFLPIPGLNPIEVKDTEEAMASLTKATRSFLGNRHKESSISTLHLKIYLINTFLREVGPLIGAATDSGLLKDLDLTILDEVDALDRSEEDMLQRAQEIDAFFIAYPSVLHCLTKLSLYNVRIDKLDTHHLLFECCKQLKHLRLSRCDTGAHSPFKIDAPNSELRVLELAKSRFERLELVCLPKLEKLGWNIWESHEAPLAFEFVPSLGELEFICDAMCGQPEFKLSELLRGTTCVHTLTLDFKGEKSLDST